MLNEEGKRLLRLFKAGTIKLNGDELTAHFKQYKPQERAMVRHFFVRQKHTINKDTDEEDRRQEQRLIHLMRRIGTLDK